MILYRIRRKSDGLFLYCSSMNHASWGITGSFWSTDRTPKKHLKRLITHYQWRKVTPEKGYAYEGWEAVNTDLDKLYLYEVHITNAEVKSENLMGAADFFGYLPERIVA